MPTTTRPARPPLRSRSVLAVALLTGAAVAAGCSAAKSSCERARCTESLMLLAAADAQAWLGAGRVVLVRGDAAAPLAGIVDTTASDGTDGPSGNRLLATSADGKRIATMAGQGDPVVVRDTTGWLGGDGSSIASI